MTCRDMCLSMGYDVSSGFFRESTPRAKKPHRCCECRDAIAVGDVHSYATGKTDGVFWSERTCAVCVEIRDAFACDGFVFTTLWEEIRDQLFPKWDEMVAIDCLAKLRTPAAVDKMRAEYAKYKPASGRAGGGNG